MSNVMNLALQITAVDMLSSVVERIKRSVLSLGPASNKVKHDFDTMTRSITTGLKAIAVGSYALHKTMPGVRAAGDLQEAMIDVKLNLMEQGKAAKVLNAELATVRSTAIDISKVAPFGAQEVVGIQNTFLKAGLKLNDVTAKGGAAWAATALATISKEAPATIADAMVTMATPFNLKGGQFKDLANWVQKVDSASVTTIPELMEGMKYVSGTAAMMKVSWQDTTQALGVIAQSGLRGSMGGTALNDFLIRLNGTSRETRKIMKALNSYLATKGGGKVEFFDQAGKMKKLPVIINDLRGAMSKLNDHQKMFVMEKIFGEQGARAAMALIKEGEGSWENIGESIRKSVDLQDKMGERLTGFNANLKALAGTAKTTLAAIFDPLLAPLSKMLSMLNDVAAAIGKIASESPALSAIVSGGAIAVGAGAAGYGLFSLLRGGAAGAKVLKGMGGVKGILKGLGGTAAGIAEGKAVQAVTGVTPVFVTNWPAGGIGGAAEAAAGAAAASKAGWLKKLATAAPVVAGGKMALALAAGGAVGTGLNMAAGGVASAVSGGQYKGVEWLGHLIYDLFNKREEPEVKNNIAIDLKVDQSGRVQGNSSDMNTVVSLNRGIW
jgi:TP901 family phage tail tape measure protein